MRNMKYLMVSSAVALMVSNAHAQSDAPVVGEATEATKAANAKVAQSLPIADQTDFENARRGFLGKIEQPILNEDGSVAWDVNQFDFIKGAAPDTVNPSLWRQGQLNNIHGLFEVTKGIYQIRGYDLAQMTLIAGKSGWIIIDPLTTPAPAKAGLALANKILGERPVSAVIYTHSHGDHFGGVWGVISPEDYASGKVDVIGPHGFLRESIGESVIAGTAMNRRVQFQFGTGLAAGKNGHVGVGLGQALSRGDVALIAPTKTVSEDGGIMEIDGITFDFMDAGETEAPAELIFYLPEFKALHSAEVVTRNFHNVLTPRGALVRDTLKWSKVIDDMLSKYGVKSDILLASHHWPTWGRENVATALKNQRGLYRYVHDQTMRQANQGATIHEIAENIGEPDFAKTDFGVRDYYGTLNHNSKAVYQRYFGWWDSVPANYYQHPPVQAAIKYVAAFGGEGKALNIGAKAFEDGDYRWSATIFNHIVFANPANEEAKNWLASSYEQLGFQSESGAWRNIYLVGAKELREGNTGNAIVSTANEKILNSIPAVDLFDSLATRFNPSRLEGDGGIIQFNFPTEKISVDVGKSVLFPRKGEAEFNARMTVSRENLTKILLRRANPWQLIQLGEIKIDGDKELISAMFNALDPVDPQFDIVTP